MLSRDQVQWVLERQHMLGLPDRLDRERHPVAYEDWMTVEEAVSQLALIGRDLASEEFERKTLNDLAERFTPSALELLRATRVG